MRIVLSGYYGFNNAGDEAILAALIAGIKRRVAEPEIIVLSAAPDWTERVQGVKAIDRYNYRRLLSVLQTTDLLISGGGSLLQDATGKKTIPYYLSIIGLAKFLQVPVFCCAQGIGPIDGWTNRQLVRVVLNQVEAITVRDQASALLLTKIGVKREINLTADPAFLLSAPAEKETNRILEEEAIELTPPVLGVTVRSWRDNQFLTPLATLLDQLLIELEAQALLIPFQYPDDKQVSYQLVELMTEQAAVVDGDYAPRQILGLVGRVDLLLGIRLHSLIFALQQGVLPLGISYDPKVDNLLAQFDLHPAAETDNFQADKAYRKIINLWKNREGILNDCAKKLETVEGLARQNLEIIEKLTRHE